MYRNNLVGFRIVIWRRYSGLFLTNNRGNRIILWTAFQLSFSSVQNGKKFC